MRTCDFCKDENTCTGVRRIECADQDYLYFKQERTPADDEEIITKLLIEDGVRVNARALARYLVRNGIGVKG